MGSIARCSVHAVLLVACAGQYSDRCTGMEVAAEVQGEEGVLCAPKCHPGSYECPLAVPPGSSARPQCMLQDLNRVGHCGLLCQFDMQCPSGSVCRRIADPPVGLCMFPQSFGDWATTSRLKLSVGWPAGAGGAGSLSARAFGALHSLKTRYGVGDGDADMLALREMLMATAGAGGAPQKAGAPRHSAGVLATWEHDVSYFAHNLKDGLPGLQREVHDTMWNLEHIQQQGVASELLRGVLLMSLMYLGVGCAYKSQVDGAKGLNMVPHIGFWRAYPKLVSDGWTYLWMILGDLLGMQSSVGRAHGMQHDDFFNTK